MRSEFWKVMRSFRYAFFGILEVCRGQLNFRIHLILALAALFLAYWIGFSRIEWIVLLFIIGLVLVSEAFNTAVELLCDHLHPEQHPAIKRVKDISAGAVLLAAITAFVAGICLFLPKLLILTQ